MIGHNLKKKVETMPESQYIVIKQYETPLLISFFCNFYPSLSLNWNYPEFILNNENRMKGFFLLILLAISLLYNIIGCFSIS